MKRLILSLLVASVYARPSHEGKRCSNLGTDDCANGWLPDGPIDDDYLGGGRTPGKRTAPGEDSGHILEVLLTNKRCANLGSDDCANGWLPDGPIDDDYLGGGRTPGKRNLGEKHDFGKRCSNLGTDDCANGWLPEAGIMDDYLGSGRTPGKRNVPQNYHESVAQLFRVLLGKRCGNLGTDDCANGWLPTGPIDDDYLGKGPNPGKRCSNLGTDDCANGWLPEAGTDDSYLGSGRTPGKRNLRKSLTAVFKSHQ